MSSLPEFVGTIHIFLGPYRGNPIALYLNQDGDTCQISPKVYPWNRIVGKGETTNKAAADFEAKWKEGGLTPELYTGPHWEGGIKPEKPKPTPPPKPATPPKPEEASPTSPSAVSESEGGEASLPPSPTPQNPSEPAPTAEQGTT